MAKRNEEVFGIVEARLVKRDCEQALKKIDEGIKWSGYAFLSLFVMAIAKGGGLGRMLKTAGKIAKWAYYLNFL